MTPREFTRKLPRTWWLRRRTYFLFMIRELTSVFVAGYAVVLMVLAWKADDEAAFGRFYETLENPWIVGLQVTVLAAVVFHTVTWINLLPKVVVLWRGERRVPARVIAGSNYVAWIVTSAVVAVLALQ